MPKQVYKIEQFHGGLNSSSDPRDIAENELSDATDIMVDELGKIRTMGTNAAHGTVDAKIVAMTAGYGLFQFSHDRKGGHVNGNDLSGEHTGGDHSTVLTDSISDWPVDALIGATVNNTTDGSSGTITDNDATTVTVAALSGGGDNSWDTTGNDDYTITGFPETGDDYLALANTTVFTDATCDYNDDPTITHDANANIIVGLAVSGTGIPDGAYIKTKTDTTHFELSAATTGGSVTDGTLTFGGGIHIYSDSNDKWSSGAIINLGSTTGMKPVFYMMDGSLRVSDGNFGADNTNKWYGYIKKTHFNVSGYEDVYDGWYSEDQTIASPTSGIVGETSDSLAGIAGGHGGTHTGSNNEAVELTDSAASFPSTLVGAKVKNITDGSSGTVASVDSSTVLTLDNLLGGTGDDFDTGDIYTISGTTTLLISPGNFANIDDDDIVGKQVILNLAESSTVAITDWNDADSIDTAAVTQWDTEDPWMMFPVAGTGFNVYVSYAEGISGWADGTYEIASTFIYDGGQESLPFKLASTFVISGSLDVPTFGIWATSPYSPRLTGGRIYYRESASNDHWALLIDINFRDGTRTGLLDSYTAWTAPTLGDDTVIAGYHWEDFDAVWEDLADTIDNTGDHWEDIGGYAFAGALVGPYVQGRHEVATPDTVNIYEILSGVSQEENTLDAKFKTAVVANRMVYIGNVETKSENNQTEVFGDAMMKSPVNKIDMFPLNRMIEVSVRDGDEIVKLETYADRLLQFKKKKVHLINISQEVEFLEDTFEHKGVLHPAAVCKTDFGIAWVNRQGCYLYNGQSVTNLLEKGGRQLIKESDWLSFTTDNSIIGYVPKKRQLIVLEDCTTTSSPPGNSYLFDMVTQSWTKGDSKFADSQIQTNLVTDWNNDLVHTHTSGTGTVVKWDDASVTTTAISFITKDIDFGQPSMRKKIYKVRISYKGDGSSVVVEFGVDGDTDGLKQFNSDDTPLVNQSDLTKWHHAELSPSTSSQANNIYSFQLYLTGTTGADFEINDISIVYRMKNIK